MSCRRWPAATQARSATARSGGDHGANGLSVASRGRRIVGAGRRNCQLDQPISQPGTAGDEPPAPPAAPREDDAGSGPPGTRRADDPAQVRHTVAVQEEVGHCHEQHSTLEVARRVVASRDPAGARHGVPPAAPRSGCLPDILHGRQSFRLGRRPRVTLLERGTGNEVPRAVVFVEFRRYPDEGSVIALGLGR